jgi:hypothetical protein
MRENMDENNTDNNQYEVTTETPRYTLDWYIKWVASVFVLGSMSLRGVEGYQDWDLTLSFIGVALWLVVSLMWNDRALIVLNGVGLFFLLRTLITGG